jgi:serine/threonine protein kinase/tetratricopeptide (TPR) repeat protein
MNDSTPEPVPVEQLAEEFLERHRRGEKPSITEYTDKYPALADEIRDLFPALVMMEELKPASEPGVSATGPGTGPSEPGAEDRPATGSSSATARKKLERLGDYRILREVGRGGMGIVYEAEQISLGRRVALKVLPAQVLLDARQQQRFQREAKAAARLHHTNIVPVFGVGEHEGLQYYVMQFINGLGLDEVLAELKRLRKAREFDGSGVRGQGSGSKPQNTARQPEIAPGTTIAAAQVAQALVTGQFAISGPRESQDVPIPPTEQPGNEHAQQISHRGHRDHRASVTSGPSVAHSSSTFDSPSSILNPRSSSILDPRSSSDSGSGRHYWQSVARIGVQVADALDYAHGQGIFHRDIKPSNLLLDNQGTVWVTDFGLAKATAEGDNLTHTGDILGTLRYMAPERFKGQSDARCDIYSLGLTLYELLVQRPAFDETDRNKLIHQVTHEEPIRPKKLNPAIPRDLETIVLKSIEREPGRRYPTARSLGEDLKRFVEDKPIRARQVSNGERLVRWCRRNKALAASIGGIAVLLFIGFVASTVIAFRFSALAKREIKAREEAEASQLQAEANLARARAAVDYFTGVAEDDLLKIPGALSLRRQVLQKAKTYYEDFLKEGSDDPALQASVAAAYLRIGRIGNDLGQYAEVREALTEAISRYIIAASTNPNHAEIQDRLADAYQAYGDVDYNERQPGKALAPWQNAVQIREALVEAHPKDAEYKEKLAVMYNRLGIAQGVRFAPRTAPNQPASAALESYRKCTEIRLELIRNNPNSPTLQYGLGESFLNLASYLNMMGHPQDALPLFLRSQEFYRAACAQMPYMVEYALDLGSLYQRIGNTYWMLGDREKAIDQQQRAVDYFRARVRAYPDVPIYRTHLADEAGYLLYRVRMDGPRPQAMKVLERARGALASVSEPTGNDLYLLAGVEGQMATFICYGKEKLTPDELAQERRLIDQTLVTFRRAVAAGFKDINQVKIDLNYMKNDPKLKGLLDRNKDFVAGLEKSTTEGSGEPGRKPPKGEPGRVSAIPASGASNDPGHTASEIRGVDTPRTPVSTSVEESGRATLIPTLTQSDLARARHAIGILKARYGTKEESEKALAEALAIRQQLVKSDPKNLQYQEDLAYSYVAQADLHWNAGRYPEALRHWQEGLDLLAQGSGTELKSVLQSGNTGGESKIQSLTAHLASVELTIANHYWEFGLWAESAEHFSKALAQSGVGNGADWANYAKVLLANGDLPGYRRVCAQMMREFGDTLGLPALFDIIYAGTLGPTEPAELARWLELAEREVAVQPNADWRMVRLAQVRYRSGHFKEALQALDQSGALDEREPLRAMVHHRLGQSKEAREWLTLSDQRSKKIAQDYMEVDALILPPMQWNWAAFQYLRREAHELIDGGERAGNVSDRNSVMDDPWLHLLRARAYYKLGFREKAEKELQAAVAGNPKDPRFWSARAGLFAQLGQFKRAETDFAKMTEGNPDDCRPWIARGRYFIEHGQPQKADADFAKGASLTPNELNKFIQAGWWVVGPYPDKLDIPYPPEKDPDPSRPVEPIQDKASILAKPLLESSTVVPGTPDPAPSSVGVAGPESSKGVVRAVRQAPGQDKLPGATGSEFGAEGRLATGSALHWTTAPTGDFGRVDLRKVFDFDKVSSYALTYVYSPDERPAVFWVGGDDHIRVWLNGQLVHEVPDKINLWAWDLKRVPVTLRAGRNTILVKVTNLGGAYGFHLRLGDYPLDRAFDYAKLGLWKESAEQFATGLARGEGPDLYPERIYAKVLAYTGDWDGFRRQFDRVYSQWGNTQNKDAGFWAATSLNIAPWEPTVGAQLLRLIENGMNPKETWRKGALAAACYRVGQYDRALQQVNESKVDGPIPWALIALCHYQMDHKEEARKWLDRLNQWHDKSLTEALASKDFKLPMDWDLWGYHLVMWREANKLIKGAEPNDGPNELALRARALKEVTKK